MVPLVRQTVWRNHEDLLHHKRRPGMFLSQRLCFCPNLNHHQHLTRAEKSQTCGCRKSLSRDRAEGGGQKRTRTVSAASVKAPKSASVFLHRQHVYELDKQKRKEGFLAVAADPFLLPKLSDPVAIATGNGACVCVNT